MCACVIIQIIIMLKGQRLFTGKQHFLCLYSMLYNNNLINTAFEIFTSLNIGSVFEVIALYIIEIYFILISIFLIFFLRERKLRTVGIMITIVL